MADYARQNGLTTTRAQAIREDAVQKKGIPETKQTTFDLFRQGLSPEQIAAQRGYSVGTIFEHLAFFVGRGDIPLSALVSEEQQQVITKALDATRGQNSLSAVKALCPPDISYTQIRLVVNALKRKPS